MRVKRNFEQIYASEEDPWAIGAADSDRYDLYVDRIVARSGRRGSVLEIGCGHGAFLARLSDSFDRLVGVDVSAQAVQLAGERFPSIEFKQGSLADLDVVLPEAGLFDTIIVSDVLYYLKERERRAGLAWIADHLARDGLAFLAGWSPGGRYLNVDEFRNLVRRDFAIEQEEVLESGHALFICRRQRTLVALTVDYETWQPQPDGFVLDWEKDVLEPTQRLLEMFDAGGAKLTIFAELGEYLWLMAHRPAISEQMAEQWRDAVSRGHDVQLHLHPNWLPELNPTVSNGRWEWDLTRARAADYPGDLAAAIERCKTALEVAIRPVAPDYEVVAFRAGTYEAQPFQRLYDALAEKGIWCDSSVVPGDRRPDRHYDYRHAYADHQPWFASRYDPQLKAPPAEREVLELPIFATRSGERWTFDNEEGALFARRLVDRLARERRRPSSEALRRRRKLRTALNHGYELLRPVRPAVNRLLPRSLATFMVGYEREQLTANAYFVLVAHTKTALDFDAIAAGLRELRSVPGLELVSVTDLARAAHAELERRVSPGPEQEAARQVRREFAAQMSSQRNNAQSERLRQLVPLDRGRILDAGCGRGVGTAALAHAHPWSTIVGADVGEEFIERAQHEFGTARLSFVVDDFAALSFADGEFDCVHADNTLEHAFDVDATLRELYRVLTDGGCIVAALPPDGLNPDRTCDNHTWKTIPSDIRQRFLAAGFVDIEIESVDVFRKLNLSPFPPSNDQMLYLRAWKRQSSADPLSRVRALTAWAYQALDPARSQTSNDPLEILAGGHAWCWGYVRVLGEALAREGYEVRWVTMIAEGHPRGRGQNRTESHEVLDVRLTDGKRVVCDPMVGVVFESSLEQILEDPSRADVPRAEDDRYSAREYALYSTSAWYRLIRRVAIRRRPNGRLRYLRASRLARSAT